MYMITVFVVLTTSVCKAEFKCTQENGWPHPRRFRFCEDLSPNATRGLLEKERDSAIKSLNECQAKLMEANTLVEKYINALDECMGIVKPSWIEAHIIRHIAGAFDGIVDGAIRLLMTPFNGTKEVISVPFEYAMKLFWGLCIVVLLEGVISIAYVYFRMKYPLSTTRYNNPYSVQEPTTSVTIGHEPQVTQPALLHAAPPPITYEPQPAASSGHGNAQAQQISEQTLHNGRWYDVVTGIRGGRYIMVNGKKVYEGQWRQ